jgi:hypothetical protein
MRTASGMVIGGSPLGMKPDPAARAAGGELHQNSSAEARRSTGAPVGAAAESSGGPCSPLAPRVSSSRASRKAVREVAGDNRLALPAVHLYERPISGRRGAPAP